MSKEAVCVCSHTADEHGLGRPCSRCVDPPCMFFFLRFWRDTVSIARRIATPDPVGWYWKRRAPLHSHAWVFGEMSEADREEVSSKCWQEARFDRFGNIECICSRPKRTGMSHCEEEYACDVIACYLLVPPGSPVAGRGMGYEDDRELSEAYQMPVGNLRFRRLLEEVLSGHLRVR